MVCYGRATTIRSRVRGVHLTHQWNGARMLKRAILHVAKWAGLFHVALFLTRKGLRILCYHGFSLDDEARFRPRLFMNPATFEQRMRLLAEKKFPVLALEEALKLLSECEVPRGAVVLTIDDGFAGVYERALPILRRFSFPATVYVTSYNVLKGTPVFRLAVQYIFWKTCEAQLTTEGLDLPLPPKLAISSVQERETVLSQIVEFGENELDEQRRSQLIRLLCKRLKIDPDYLITSRIVSIMSPTEIRAAAASGMDIQLHTHRHQFQMDRGLAMKEIEDNRSVLEPLVAKQLFHFCYPSGIWDKRQWPWLEELQINSATTCVPGLNYCGTPRLGLKRFLDGENVHPIEFESEVYGFSPLLRSVRAVFRTHRPISS